MIMNRCWGGTFILHSAGTGSDLGLLKSTFIRYFRQSSSACTSQLWYGAPLKIAQPHKGARGLKFWLSGSSIYVQALKQKLQAQSNWKPVPSYIKGVLRRFVNCAIQAELLFTHTYTQRRTDRDPTLPLLGLLSEPKIVRLRDSQTHRRTQPFTVQD